MRTRTRTRPATGTATGTAPGGRFGPKAAGVAAALTLVGAAVAYGPLDEAQARPAPATAEATSRHTAADPAAQVWITTRDGSRRLAHAGEAPFTGRPQGTDIRIDPGAVGQRFTGAGASVTESSAHLIRRLPADQRKALLTSLFSREGDGIGLNYLRQPLGSSDFNTDANFTTYEDTKGAFTIDRDKKETLPVVREALAVNPRIRFMGSPWSAPAWMKNGGSLKGGSLNSARYQDYADYLVKAIKAYQAEGVKLTDLTVQNEPEFANSTYPSMSMTSGEQAAFLKVLDKTLTAAGLNTNVLAYDHNWDHPNYPLDVFGRTTGMKRLIGAAFHCYGGSPEAQQQVRDAGKRVFFTECSGTDSSDASATFGDTLKWHAENLVVRNMRSGGETVVSWNLALDENGGPHQGLCATRCNGVVETRSNGTVSRNAEFYMLGHLTKFVDEGATRIGSTGDSTIQNVAFQNPNGSRVVYAVNTGSAAKVFSVTDAGRTFTYTLPAGAVATFTWRP
ncbi:glycoside hydrolase family 30 protein [Streptomyces sp. SYP-A7185]|uniref:glycoside hydrolase family 30 protein n=1 Tax=Streptomyces sp. SYP-A7185 TaxID=3040076 RepID=UPI0038F63DDC